MEGRKEEAKNESARGEENQSGRRKEEKLNYTEAHVSILPRVTGFHDFISCSFLQILLVKWAITFCISHHEDPYYSDILHPNQHLRRKVSDTEFERKKS
jgi:hypothetical protein